MQKIKYLVGILTVIIIGGAFFGSCQKEEPIATNTEGITSVKEQKGSIGHWIVVNGYYEYVDANGEIVKVFYSGEVFVDDVKKKKTHGKVWVWIPSKHDPNSPSNVPPILLEWDIKPIINPDDYTMERLRDFNSYAMKVNNSELQTSFNLNIEYEDTDGHPHIVLVDYHCIKAYLWPGLIERIIVE